VIYLVQLPAAYYSYYFTGGKCVSPMSNLILSAQKNICTDWAFVQGLDCETSSKNTLLHSYWGKNHWYWNKWHYEWLL